VSDELDELSACDRVLVVFKGRITDEFAAGWDSEKLVAAMKGLKVDTPFGNILFRELDHQSTMGAYVGRTARKDGKGVMTAWTYSDGAKFLPPDAEVRKLRPAE